MAFQPQTYTNDASPVLHDERREHTWTPLFWHECSFSSEIFTKVMMNLIRNPNVNSNHLFRADILMETRDTSDCDHITSEAPRPIQMDAFDLETTIVRRLIPRNALVDEPLDQTCLIYTGRIVKETKSLVIYLPHVSNPSEVPFYHPSVRGIAFLHTLGCHLPGVVSIHYSCFTGAQTPSLTRTAYHLLATLYKHGHGLATGYIKRVHHDRLLPQARVQNTYARLKAKYAKTLIAQWVEATDPTKHVFEDLGIAAFLIELWADLYPKPSSFPGFVDIGCGNGLLVHILLEENYLGWGFDARKRKSWDKYPHETKENLKELVLIPAILHSRGNQADRENTDQSSVMDTKPRAAGISIHNGEFAQGTFIISNHADELTPWTPVLANLSESPFLMIPCCSHNLTGARFRAPASKQLGVSNSAYASLVSWVSGLADSCGWQVEKEMLRIPSTRNTALLGRRRTTAFADIDVAEIVEKYGGACGWKENAMKLVKSGPRGH
ncbi:MAG: tRNA(Ser) Um(44) 2'-O-methyltransferase [Claussenomyces sp. TS43310]|nr:MAG: tRNA(Ser) Um(44) 2'-O-methyltransferase [Claussenomyces sp. TS43310]